VLLSFHPLAWTSVCAEQMKSLEKNKETFDSLNTIAVGVSVDTVPSKKAWADSLGIRKTRLLSDFWPHGKVAKLYGIFRQEDGISERANIIIDETQKIAFFKVYRLGQLPDIQEIIKTL
jgi:peroxiredoxin